MVAAFEEGAIDGLLLGKLLLQQGDRFEQLLALLFPERFFLLQLKQLIL